MNDHVNEMFDAVYAIIATESFNWPVELSEKQCITLIERMIEHFELIDEFDKCNILQCILEKMK